jgi:hypothetical protein
MGGNRFSGPPHTRRIMTLQIVLPNYRPRSEPRFVRRRQKSPEEQAHAPRTKIQFVTKGAFAHESARY